MTSTTRENASYFLSWVGRLFIAGVGVCSGASLAVFSLAAQPVEVLKKAPTAEQLASGKHFYLPGERDGNRGRMWSSKRKAMFSGQTGVITFTEEELNSWFSGTFRTPPPRNPKAPPPDIVGEGINFRVAEGQLQIGLPVVLNYFAEPMRLILQTRGNFALDGDRWCFAPTEVWIGALPAHRLPGLLEALREKQLDESWVPAEALAAWKRIGEIRVEDRLLQLRLD